jgi:hypothetical protein
MDIPQEMKMISGENLMMNSKKIHRFRIIMFIVGGIVCGVLGLTSVRGLIFFFGITALSSLALAAKMKFDCKKYSNLTLIQLIIQSMSSTAMTFLLFWTLSFALVYIY